MAGRWSNVRVSIKQKETPQTYHINYAFAIITIWLQSNTYKKQMHLLSVLKHTSFIKVHI